MFHGYEVVTNSVCRVWGCTFNSDGSDVRSFDGIVLNNPTTGRLPCSEFHAKPLVSAYGRFVINETDPPLLPIRSIQWPPRFFTRPVGSFWLRADDFQMYSVRVEHDCAATVKRRGGFRDAGKYTSAAKLHGATRVENAHVRPSSMYCTRVVLFSTYFDSVKQWGFMSEIGLVHKPVQ